MKGLLVVISFYVLLVNLQSQTITYNEDSTSAVIENNRIHFPFSNNGDLAFSNGPDGSLINMQYDEKMVVFAGGFYLSGYSDTTLWANAVAPAELLNDYLPGNIDSESDDSRSIIYSVRSSDEPFGEEWQNWKHAVTQGAYFYDGDNDGIYNPVDKNGNGQWDADEDKPDILYDGSLFAVFNDGIPAENRRWNTVDPLGIEIRQTVFVSNRNIILDDVVFVRYSILYKGFGNPSEPDSLTDVIFSIWSDCDIGGIAAAAADDLSGCDTLLQSGFTYNHNEDDDFGINPPSVFKTIVQGPLVKSNKSNDIGYNKMGPDLGEHVLQGYNNAGMNSFASFVGGTQLLISPRSANEARNFMLGRISTGEEVDPCNWAYGEVRGDVDCSALNPALWYSGDPVTDYGWICEAIDDQRDLTSTGKFTLHKNEPMDIIVAYTVGRGTDHLNSITVARKTVQYIHEEYTRNFSTIVGVEEEKDEVPSSFTLFQNYPNPFNPSTKIKFNIPNVVDAYYASTTRNTTLKVYDVLGREIKTLISKQLQPGEYEIEFDASDLPSGVYFYRLNAGSFSESRKMLLLK